MLLYVQQYSGGKKKKEKKDKIVLNLQGIKCMHKIIRKKIHSSECMFIHTCCTQILLYS